jgi:hypothetical protein
LVSHNTTGASATTPLPWLRLVYQHDHKPMVLRGWQVTFARIIQCPCAALPWTLRGSSLLRPQNKFLLLHVHLALKEAQHAVFVGLLSRYRDFSLFYCLPHNASAGMLAGSSLALKSFSILLCIINSISSISDRTALNHFVFIPVAPIPVFYGLRQSPASSIHFGYNTSSNGLSAPD